MRRQAIFLLLMLGTAAAAAPAPEVLRVEILSSGTYAVDVAAREESQTATGTMASVRTARLLDDSPNVQGRIGQAFGFEYRPVGRPEGAEVSMKHVVRFPNPGLRNPKTGKTSLMDETHWQARIGSAILFQGYTFDEAWEIVPGTWILEVWYGDRKLASRSFTVRRP